MERAVLATGHSGDTDMATCSYMDAIALQVQSLIARRLEDAGGGTQGIEGSHGLSLTFMPFVLPYQFPEASFLGVTPNGYSWRCLGDHMRCQGKNPCWPYASQVPTWSSFLSTGHLLPPKNPVTRANKSFPSPEKASMVPNSASHWSHLRAIN